MGWTYGYGDTKKDAIRYALADWDATKEGGSSGRILKHCLRGNHVYAVRETTDANGEKTRYALVVLLSTDGDGNWGSKVMDETMHPYYYACPLGYLGLLTEPANESAEKWREGVRAHHARLKARREMLKGLEPGDTLKLKPGMTLAGSPLTEVTFREKAKGWLRVDVGYGRTRVRPAWVVGVERKAEAA